MADDRAGLVAKFDGELVLVCEGADQSEGTLYPHAEFLSVFQAAFLDRIQFSIPPGMKVKSALRVIARMRTVESHKATLTDALGRLRRQGHPVDASALTDGKHRSVAVFPLCA